MTLLCAQVTLKLLRTTRTFNNSLQMKAASAVTHLQHLCALDIKSKASFVRLSGIISTIGPASRDPSLLEKMMKSGMNVARLNFSHGSHDYHAKTIHNIRTAVANYSKNIGMPYSLAIALDTKGPEIRTGLLQGGDSAEIVLKKGETIRLTTDKAHAEAGNKDIVYVDYENIHKVVTIGTRVYVDDGLISLICTEIQGSTLTCTVENGGNLGSRKGVNLPGVAVDLPAISEKDKSDLKFAIKEGVDVIFASFVRNGTALDEIRDSLGSEGNNILIISKIENQQGVDNLDDIIEKSDGIMVARGDLGIEIPTEKVFLAQKAMIAKCNRAGKPIICATQMLESMVRNPRPTRAESSDVANAIIDGADCVMLSGETAKGHYPLECVQTMASICQEAESVIWQKELLTDLSNMALPPLDKTHALAIAAVEATIKCEAKAIIVATLSGRSAHLISKYRPTCPIISVTRNAQVARQCQLRRGIFPLFYEPAPLPDWLTDVEARIQTGIKFGLSRGFIRANDLVVIVTRWNEQTEFINTMRIARV